MSAMSPELALVDPELRAAAIATLPRIEPLAFLARPPAPAAAFEPAARPRFTASAALAYLLVAVARTCAFDALVFAGVAAGVLVLSLVS